MDPGPFRLCRPRLRGRLDGGAQSGRGVVPLRGEPGRRREAAVSRLLLHPRTAPADRIFRLHADMEGLRLARRARLQPCARPGRHRLRQCARVPPGARGRGGRRPFVSEAGGGARHVLPACDEPLPSLLSGDPEDLRSRLALRRARLLPPLVLPCVRFAPDLAFCLRRRSLPCLRRRHARLPWRVACGRRLRSSRRCGIPETTPARPALVRSGRRTGTLAGLRADPGRRRCEGWPLRRPALPCRARRIRPRLDGRQPESSRPLVPSFLSSSRSASGRPES